MKYMKYETAANERAVENVALVGHVAVRLVIIATGDLDG